jgi:hypothetical protein
MLVHQRKGGLLVAEQAAVPREIASALRRVDPRLELRQEIDRRYHSYLWRVFVTVPDRPSVWLFDWREEMGDPLSRPRPLSHGIVSEASERRLGSRRAPGDPLAANDAERERDNREAEELFETAADEARRRNGRLPALHRSPGLRRSRDRARSRGEHV